MSAPEAGEGKADRLKKQLIRLVDEAKNYGVYSDEVRAVICANDGLLGFRELAIGLLMVLDE